MSGDREARDHPSILQVNSADTEGGAARVMTNLHRAYVSRGLASWMAVGTKCGDLAAAFEIPNDDLRGIWARKLTAAAGRAAAEASPRRGARWLAARALLLAAEPIRYARILSGVEDFDFPGTARILDLPPKRPDILHLHNLHGYYFDLRMLPSLASQQPTILTMHDAWLLAGHCAHPFDCPRWRTGCGDCPDVGAYVAISRDASDRNWAIKQRALQGAAVSLATPSRWLARMVEDRGLMLGHADTRVIPNGVDTSIFNPGDRDSARAVLGIPGDAEVVLAVGQRLAQDPYKDYSTLVEAMRRLGAKRPGRTTFVALGGTAPTPAIDGVKMLPFPRQNDAGMVALFYRAADLYVHAARADNLPLAIIEAMACGLPVIASRAGGIPELVEEGRNGMLVDPADSSMLADAILRLLKAPELRASLGAAGARRASDEFTIDRQASAYISWYSELLTNDHATPQPRRG